MGMDIHMSIINGDHYLQRKIFDGRNSEWFNNLMNRGCDPEYEHIPTHFGIPEECPEDIKNDFKKPAGDGYFGFNYITVEDFCKWFEKYRPDLDAGWVSTYDKWRIEKKHYIPDYVPHELNEEDNKDDMHFIEIINYHDCSRWLYKKLKNDLNKKKILPSSIIVFYFDW